MKFTTVMTVLAIALCVVGCKYDKAAKKGLGAGDSAATATGIESQDISSNAQSGSLANASESKFEDMYGRCTDVDFAPVYFAFDSAVVPSGELGKVETVAQHLQSKPERVVVVEGNCDERGSNEYNMPLGENRAIIVRNYLVQNGISADRIQTRSYGAERPAVEGHDESAWSRNRRAEFAIYDTTVRK